MKTLTMKEKLASSFDVLKEEFGYKNKLAAPRITKVVVNAGIGSGMKRDKTRKDLVIDRLSKITGQHPTVRGAKQSIASFKIRQGDPVGVTVTMRGARMETFLDKLVNVSLPRTKDFRGLNRSTVSDLGNMTIGMKEHTIFPEASDEDVTDVFGLSIAIVTTAKSRKEALALFSYLGFPLKEEDEKKKKRLRKKR